MKKVAFSKLSTNALGLKRLPVPPLADTMERYAASVKPLKKEPAVNAHLDKMKLFQETSAKDIQKELVDADVASAKTGEYPHSYIEKTWDDGYLAFRGPLAINIAPSIALKKLPNVSGQAATAAAYVHGMLRFIRKITEEGVDIGKNATDVSAFQHQFSFARVPEAERDTLHQADITKAKTITAMCRGQLYTVKVIDDNGLPYSQEIIAQTLRHVVAAAEKDNGPNLSYLTACGRSDWATSYSDLISGDPGNKDLLAEVHDSLIVVCLDQAQWGKENTMKLEAMLYGGTELSNRWYDKHQMIVDPDGSTAMCFEHSFSDGVVWSRWVQEVHSALSGGEKSSGYSDLPSLRVSSEAKPDSASLMKHLAFSAGKSFGSRIRTAEQELQKLTRGVLLDEVVLPFGKSKLKKLGVSPDAFCQMTMHWSYYQMRHKVAPTYESCSTGGFWHGRTETIRSATAEMRELVTLLDQFEGSGALQNISTENGSKVNQLIHATASRHVSLAKEASMGLGVDRHLLSLKELVKAKKDTNGLAFFNDELFPYSGTWVMSTSNLSLPYVDSFNFGPVTPHGLGIGYSVQEDTISMAVSTFKTSSKTKIKDFCQLVKKSSHDLCSVLERTNGKRK